MKKLIQIITNFLKNLFKMANTGVQEKEQIDNNQYSPTYNQTRWVNNGINYDECPIGAKIIFTARNPYNSIYYDALVTSDKGLIFEGVVFGPYDIVVETSPAYVEGDKVHIYNDYFQYFPQIIVYYSHGTQSKILTASDNHLEITLIDDDLGSGEYPILMEPYNVTP